MMRLRYYEDKSNWCSQRAWVANFLTKGTRAVHHHNTWRGERFCRYNAAPVAPAVSVTSLSMKTLALPTLPSTSSTERPGTFSRQRGPENPAFLKILM